MARSVPAAIHARKRAEATRPNRVEGTMVTPGRDVRAEEIVDEMLEPTAERVLDLGVRPQGGDVRRRVLTDRDDVAALRPDHLQQPPVPILARELTLLDARRERGREP